MWPVTSTCSCSRTCAPATSGTRPWQRSSGAIAVGPVLQGLNRPVNDLSRGALVQDIINTVALTAIEAQ